MGLLRVSGSFIPSITITNTPIIPSRTITSTTAISTGTTTSRLGIAGVAVRIKTPLMGVRQDRGAGAECEGWGHGGWGAWWRPSASSRLRRSAIAYVADDPRGLAPIGC